MLWKETGIESLVVHPVVSPVGNELSCVCTVEILPSNWRLQLQRQEEATQFVLVLMLLATTSLRPGCVSLGAPSFFILSLSPVTACLGSVNRDSSYGIKNMKYMYVDPWTLNHKEWGTKENL
jgi:hypothetical protein